MEFDIEKDRFSFRLTAPYSEERRRAASEAAKAAASNFIKSMIYFFEKTLFYHLAFTDKYMADRK